MGYFSNGTEGMCYQESFCNRCVHDKDNDCPVWNLHLLWNSEQHDDKHKRLALDLLIPRKGIENEQCKMFRLRQTRQKSKQMRFPR